MKRKRIKLSEEDLRRIIKTSVKTALGNSQYPSSDDNFDLNQIPMEILDKGWQRYHPYLLGIGHRHPLSNGIVEEKTDYRKQITLVKEIITKTFPISESQFLIKGGGLMDCMEQY